MTDCIIERNNGRLILHLTGELMIDYADRLRSVLIDSFRTADHVDIDAAKVTALDIACLQLFCAGHKTAMEMKKSLRLLDASPPFIDSARQAGVTRERGCMAGKNVPCVWTEERP